MTNKWFKYQQKDVIYISYDCTAIIHKNQEFKFEFELVFNSTQQKNLQFYFFFF